MIREGGQYRFTDYGESVWRVEHTILDRVFRASLGEEVEQVVDLGRRE